MKDEDFVCLCHSVPLGMIKKCITDGAKNILDIVDATTAGVGPCGGTCRRTIGPLLEHYLKNGRFPDNIKRVEAKKPKR